ncbi:DUF6702 family protein [Tenacibaculum jejuense]|uniref:Peptidase E n=1 Tax=Tenacibaculum jejuense TaxID=584609 RepID=A0A238UAC8_9FLAO|nr:DUF6702 family protein [Tenacibaculum jejuense]SNR16157.1 conserved protein of unknown function [Tenacibaculum jejuense]
MKKILFLLIGVSFLSFIDHKYYIALTEIEHNKESESVQMIMNVFVDDIEDAINKDYDADLQLNTKLEAKNTDQLFFKYLNEHFKILINNKAYSYNFIGKEYDGDIVYFYLEIDNIIEVKSIEVKNDVLTQHFPDQQNLIKSKINGERKSLFLTKKNDKGLLKF